MTTTFNPKTDIAEIKRTISLLYQSGDVVELRALDFNGKPHAGYFNDFDKLATAAARLSGTMMGVYLVLNPIKKELLARAVNRIADGPKNLTADADIISRRWFPIDVDANRAPGISSTDEEHEFTITTAKDIKAYLITMGFLANSIIIADSGNGAHLLVRIDIPNDTDNKALIQSCIEALKAKFESDKAIIDKTVFNAARIWKCYGTICKKGDSTEDRPHRTANLLEVPANIVITPIEALKALAATTPQPETPQAPKTTYHSNGQEFDLDTWMSTHGIEVTKKEPYNGGTRYILKVCPFNSNHTGTSAAIFKMSNGAIVYKCQHDGCIDNDWRKLREMLEPEYADRKRQYEQRAQLGPGASLENNGLPEIRVTGRNTKDITTDAIDALHKSNIPPTMFKRGSLPVRVSKDECDTPYIEVMNEPALRGRLDRVATYVKYVKKQGKQESDEYKVVPTAVPLDVVRDVMSLPDFRLPALANITEIPALRANGSILSTPGYDPVSKLYYVPSRNLIVPKIPENPTTEEVRETVNLINEVYINFPFDSPASRTNAIAATATCIYRPMFDGNVPLFIISKPQAGVGAGLVTAALCMTTTGRDPAMFGAPKDEDEWAKVIFAAVKAGQQIIIFDNCDGVLYSANLARLITAKTIGGRILGRSENAVMPNNSMIFCNGNNITLDGDLPRRSYLSRMETDADMPWERECNYLHSPLIPWVKANQGRIVAAYLTIAKAWIAAGKPLDDSLPRLGGFEEWQTVIGGVLKNAGIEGFLGNRETVYRISDTGSQQWEAFTEALISVFPEDFTVADIANLIFPKKDTEITPQGSDLNNALPDFVDKDPRKFSTSLGRALNTKLNVKWHNGWVITKPEKIKPRHHAVVWKIINWREGSAKTTPEGVTSPPIGTQGRLGEVNSLPTHYKTKNNNSYIDTGVLTSPTSPLSVEKGEVTKNPPVKLEKLGGKCSVCGKEDTEGMWVDDSPEGHYFYCTNCHPNFNEEVE
jgi:hypothetical protein